MRFDEAISNWHPKSEAITQLTCLQEFVLNDDFTLSCLNFRQLRANLTKTVHEAQKQCPGAVPGLAIVQVGGRDDSNVYIRMKIRAAAEIGINAQHIQLPRTVTQHELLVKVSKKRTFRSWLTKHLMIFFSNSSWMN